MKTAEQLYSRMFKHRVGHNDLNKWHHIFAPHSKQEILKTLNELLDKKYRVTTGWSSTNVRGYHRYIIYWLERKTPTSLVVV